MFSTVGGGPLTRGAVVVLVQERVALIRREHPERGVYHLFPGGKVEPGESPAEAAVREAYEELGVHVRLTALLAVETFEGSLRYYYRAEIEGGTFGTGSGAELSCLPGSPRGTYTPIWLPVRDLASREVYPRYLARRLSADDPFPAPVHFTDDDAGMNIR